MPSVEVVRVAWARVVTSSPPVSRNQHESCLIEFFLLRKGPVYNYFITAKHSIWLHLRRQPFYMHRVSMWTC